MTGIRPAPCAHLRGGLQLAATAPHLSGFQRGSSPLPAEIASSCSGFAPPVKMRDARLFKSWANSQTHQQLVPQGPLILGSRSVTLNSALCFFQSIDRV
ncbi:hypothetical protein PBY51_021662 [Eleginops maclovinus]|uniref:Uncharacterized protein n=1 Tax=Eleginops maclovinus TaxID=56733 RepID=A0AAN7XDP4_ELEMC|nr:hypothetical protein PBY51_021662 [Eleginops maclovinus]